QPEGHRAPPQKAGQLAKRFQLGFLHDVRRIDPAAQTRIQTQRDQLPQVRTMPREERLERLAFAGFNATQEMESLFRVWLYLNHAKPLSTHLHVLETFDRGGKKSGGRTSMPSRSI